MPSACRASARWKSSNSRRRVCRTKPPRRRKRSGTYVITLEILGKTLDSPQLADKLAQLALEGKSNLAFVIGGSLGLSDEVSKRADFKLSFSKMTFPHQMMRVILLEQIYRAFKINRNETYHK